MMAILIRVFGSLAAIFLVARIKRHIWIKLGYFILDRCPSFIRSLFANRRKNAQSNPYEVQRFEENGSLAEHGEILPPRRADRGGVEPVVHHQFNPKIEIVVVQANESEKKSKRSKPKRKPKGKAK